MKNLLMIAMISITTSGLMAQADSTKPVFARYPLPQFSILLPDSVNYFTKFDLPKGESTIIILFSPDCEHCQHETELIIKNIDKFKGTHIVMTTTLPFDKMKEFYNKYNLKDYPSITVGRDTRHFFGGYFSPAIHSVPFIAVYDSKETFKKVFDGGQKIEVLLDALN